MTVKSAGIEAAVVLLLGAVLAALSLGLLVAGYGGSLRLTFADVATAGAAGIAAAAVVRLNVRLHRRWKKTIGRLTAAAALCALAALVGALVVMVPSECPGGLFSTGRCGVKESAAWGQVAGLAAVVNFGLIGIVLAAARGLWRVLRDGSAQGAVMARALGGMVRGRGFRRIPAPPRDPRAAKGRPTPRRADAERARRERLRARA